MGHSSIETTFARYGHLLPGNESEAAALLDAYLERELAVRRLTSIGWASATPTCFVQEGSQVMACLGTPWVAADLPALGPSVDEAGEAVTVVRRVSRQRRWRRDRHRNNGGTDDRREFPHSNLFRRYCPGATVP